MPVPVSRPSISSLLALDGLPSVLLRGKLLSDGSRRRPAPVRLFYSYPISPIHQLISLNTTDPRTDIAFLSLVESGPTVFFMTVTMMALFGSAFFTDIIGVHAIFGTVFYSTISTLCVNGSLFRIGAFIVGLIVPREGGLAIALTEKLEDMVAIIFLPLVRTSFPFYLFHLSSTC